MNIFINFKGESMVKYIANVPYHKKIASNHNVLNIIKPIQSHDIMVFLVGVKTRAGQIFDFVDTR